MWIKFRETDIERYNSVKKSNFVITFLDYKPIIKKISMESISVYYYANEALYFHPNGRVEFTNSFYIELKKIFVLI